jgi:hypothetical protein
LWNFQKCAAARNVSNERNSNKKDLFRFFNFCPFAKKQTMPKRSRSQANPYTQLPYVLRIYVLSFLNKMEDNDNLTGLYGYFTDDFMRKPCRVFNRNIRIETTYNNPNNDGSSQPTIYYSGCESCELVINSLDMLKLPITLLQIQEVCKKIRRV